MKSRLIALLTLVLTLSVARAVEPTWDYAVQISSVVQTSPAKITLSWPQDTTATPASYTVYRKTAGASSWGSGTILAGSATSYADTSVVAGTPYEYQIIKNSSSYSGYGYIQTGVNAPLSDNRGKVVLIVENTYAAALASELTRLQQDLTGDGWTVLRHDVNRSDSVTTVKNLIKADYNADSANVKSVFLFGHVPVPYSGQLSPDGHPDHTGAWPADAFYGDMDGNWTDSSVNYTQSMNTDPNDAARLTNRPGDGKFDQTTLPSTVELQVGRVDLANMPGRTTWNGPATFPSEQELLRNYLNKDHNFRHRIMNVQRRGVVGDYFGVRNGEAFAASGYRNFAPFFGANGITNLNTLHNDTKGVWVPHLAANDYLWAYGCGAGSYASIGGLGNTGQYNDADTVEVVNNDVHAVFTLFFGSWLGDWDHEDNILRSVLATSSNGLASAWSGRPHWFVHPMGLGETIGYAAKLTQNNSGTYKNQINNASGSIHVALMGDPTLRMHPVAPAASFTGTLSGSTATVSWGASVDSVVGYHVYRAPSATGSFTRLTGSPVTGNSFVDTSAASGAVYMVRAVKLESTPSGSYYNASQGLFWTASGGGGGGGSDTTAPTVSLTSPANGATVSGSTVNVAATAADNVAVVGVQFKLDGANLGAEDTTAPYAFTWNSTTASNGAHALTAIARDAAGNQKTSSAINVTVSNVSGDTTAPTVSLTAPTNGATVSGSTVNVAATAADNVAVVGVQFKLDGANLGAEDTTAPYAFTWNSTTASNGAHALTAIARDAAGNQKTSSAINVTVSNVSGDTTAPAISMTGPASNSIVSGSAVKVSATASDNVGVVGVQFRLDGVNLGAEDTKAPFTVTWNSTTSSNGLHGLTAVARDAAGNQKTTGSRAVVVSNVVVNPPPPPTPGSVVWLEDAVPSGAGSSASGGDAWTWVTASPAPYSGGKAHQSNIASGLHEHAFNWANNTLPVAVGDVLFTYVYIDPANPPSELMLSWNADNWEHRAYWGANLINNGINGTASRRYVGALPTAGQWVRLEVAASAVGLEGKTLTGMSYSLYGGRATWDYTGKGPATPVANDTVWIEDTLPANAGGSGSGGDAWTWISTSPTPFSGTKAHQSNIASGLHEHAFNWANPGLALTTGDVLFTYVYIDPANRPTELMLSWMADNWEHRAYWGANTLPYGIDGTASRRYVGALPAAGQWVRLEVPASAVGLEGQTVTGMSFSIYDGRVTWDRTGKGSSTGGGGGDTGPVTVTVTATDDTATVDSTSDNAKLSFARTGSTASALTVNYTLGGTATKWLDYRRAEGDMPVSVVIPAGAASTVMDLVAVGNSTGLAAATATFTLTADAAYTIGSPSVATITLLSGGGAGDPPPPPPPGDGTDYDVDTTPLVSPVDYTKMQIPASGDATLHVLSPTTLELVRVNGKPTSSSPVDSWDFVSDTGVFTAPATSKFNVTVGGQTVAVQSVGFKRRPLYAPLINRDLRIVNSLVLQLASPVAEGQTVDVKNPDASLWPTSMKFAAVAHPLRYSPALHVNQEGYVPSWPKKAAVGYYLGSLGEMAVSTPTFAIVDAATGKTVHTGSLVTRADIGWTYSPAPYQKVYEADFTSFVTPGEYKLVVPGLGASLPFLIDDGIGMNFARTYAQGLYHQRCGHENALPFTRFTHDACHTEVANVPSPASSFGFTWTTIAGYANSLNANNAPQIAPRLTSESAQLYPFVNKGTVDVSGGHHDAGDYSKYTTNAAVLLHTLMFGVDAFPGVSALDNLGLPESGDGVSDILQEAKIEADFLAKLQDADGGFYFIVYPREREYESNVLPEQGDAQVVWPKTTSATAAAVAALAETASSPRFKAAYPTQAAAYLVKAKAGWSFLTTAIAKHGKDGSYQKLTHYGDDFTHDDELAWAAAAMFAATGDATIHATLKSWYNPADSTTWRWGWWHGYSSYGNAVRSYAFAARTGRLTANQLDAAYLAKCETEVRAAGDDALTWSKQSAYGTSFPEATKHVQSAGWYFSSAQAFDITVAYQLDAKAEYLDAIIRNLNYEAGSNAVNVSYITGLGWKRQQEIVHQYAQNDGRALPPNGIPLGNLQTGPVYTGTYGTELAALTFPSDGAGTAPHGFYDRWSDTFNVATEFVHLDQARSLASLAFMATLTPAKSQAWKSATGTIVGVPANIVQGTPFTVSLQSALDLDGARIVWEGSGQSPAYGETYTFTPNGYGTQWIEAEAQWADGRRVSARATLFAENGLPTVSVVATDAIATIGNANDNAVYTFTRVGSTTSAITVNFRFSGSAAKWTDYRRPEGDMPESLTIPAGAASATMTIMAIANSSGADPATAILTLDSGSGYNVGNPKNATITLQ